MTNRTFRRWTQSRAHHNFQKELATMFSDPQSVTISAVAIPLPKTTVGENKGVYTSADGTVSEIFTHTYGRRNRRSASLIHSKIASDVFVPDVNIKHSMTFRLSVDVPPVGYTAAEQKAVIDGFLAQLQASSGALITKFLGGES